MLNKQEKNDAVAELKEKFSRAKGIVLTEYKGLTVQNITEMRNEFRAKGIEYKVVKNTLARIASNETSVSAAKDHFKGPIGIAISYEDAAQAAKSVLDYAKKNDTLKVTGGVIDGMFCDATALKRIADLPSREVLLSMMAGTFKAPASKMAALLSATITRFGYAMTALRDKKQAAG